MAFSASTSPVMPAVMGTPGLLGEPPAHLGVAAVTQLGKERRASEDDHVATVVHEVQRRFLDALELPLEVGVHQLPDGARCC